MKCHIGIGSNLGDRRNNIEAAVKTLHAMNGKVRISPIYETPALVTADSPVEWRLPYLNAVAEMEWTESPQHLLSFLKTTETEMGRSEGPRWSPRVIDLDLLAFGNDVFHSESLCIPHREMSSRSFVLDPLKDIAPLFRIPGREKPVTVQARGLRSRTALLMGIVNLTPDSFSDGGETSSLHDFESKIREMSDSGVQIIDVGAESTRPGATPVSEREEWNRLEGALGYLRDMFRGRFTRPLISVDTRDAAVAKLALETGADIVNDVGGAADPRMLEILKSSPCDFVLMHSLTVPADPRVTLESGRDPVNELKTWLNGKLERLDSYGIDLSRVIFDPGIGFGKSAHQSQTIIRRFREFADLPVRLMVGHSRKSFMKTWASEDRDGLDASTAALSLHLCEAGADILRVHNFKINASVLRTRQEVV